MRTPVGVTRQAVLDYLIREADLDGLPEEFVLKPTFLFSAIGVQVLARTDKGFYDSMSDKEYTIDQIVKHQQQMSLKSKSAKKPYIVEERIREGGEQRLD